MKTIPEVKKNPHKTLMKTILDVKKSKEGEREFAKWEDNVKRWTTSIRVCN